MKLTELLPKFIKYNTHQKYVLVSNASVENNFQSTERSEKLVNKEYIIYIASLEGAQGLSFLCPVCFEKNKGSVGTHRVEISFAGKGAKDNQGSQDVDGKPLRWSVSGTDINDLTIISSIPSSCGLSSQIVKGEVMCCTET